MNIPNPYFQGVPDVGDLEFKYCFYFLNRPMLFVCTDNNKRIDGSRNYYLCSCYELTKNIGWIIAKISKDLLLNMINNNVSLRDTFNQCTKKYVAVFTAGDKYEKVVETNKFDDDLLPVINAYLDMEDNEYDDLIRELKK